MSVYSGMNGDLLFFLEGWAHNDLMGEALSRAGDLNNDGFSDFIAGADDSSRNGSQSGAAYAYSGLDGSLLMSVFGDSPGDFLGAAVSGIGDVNGDGFDDVIAGAPGDDDGGFFSGSARVYAGPSGAVLNTVHGHTGYIGFGASVSGVGDVDGDGLSDFICGAPGDDSAGNGAGSASLFSGASATHLLTVSGSINASLGAAVCGAGDMNNDGIPDFAAGATGDATMGLNAGAVHVYSSLDGALLLSQFGTPLSIRFGRQLSHAGDVDGDGFPDLVSSTDQDSTNGYDSGMARVFTDLNGTLRTLGPGCPGSGGFVPTLSVSGTARLGTPAGIRIGNAEGGAWMALALSGRPGQTDLGNGCVLQIGWPADVFLPLGTLTGSGPGEGSLEIGSSFHTLTGIFGQALFTDSSAGVVVSNGLELVVTP